MLISQSRVRLAPFHIVDFALPAPCRKTSFSIDSVLPSTLLSPLPSPTLFFIYQDVQEVCIVPFKLFPPCHGVAVRQLS